MLSHINFNTVGQMAAVLIKDKIKFFPQYTNYAKVFSLEEAIKLLEHTFDNYKTILK